MRVDFVVTGTSSPDSRIAENIAHARSLGLPFAVGRAGGGPLNVIGRGPSAADHIDELREGENWACGTAWAWCRDNGIDATLIMADPNPRLAEPRYVEGVSRAIVASQCAPEVFAALAGASVEIADHDTWAVGHSAAVIAAILGATAESETRLFGCEGSYAATTHVNEDIPQPNEMLVRCNGRAYRTNPQMIIQCEEFVRLFEMCRPGVFVDRSGGLLGAMLATKGDWDLLEWKNAPANVQRVLDYEMRRGLRFDTAEIGSFQ